MNNRMPMATRATRKQLDYLSYWQARGYRFDRDAVIPESTLIKPGAWNLPRHVDLLVSAAMLAVVFIILKVAT